CQLPPCSVGSAKKSGERPVRQWVRPEVKPVAIRMQAQERQNLRLRPHTPPQRPRLNAHGLKPWAYRAEPERGTQPPARASIEPTHAPATGAATIAAHARCCQPCRTSRRRVTGAACRLRRLLHLLRQDLPVALPELLARPD